MSTTINHSFLIERLKSRQYTGDLYKIPGAACFLVVYTIFSDPYSLHLFFFKLSFLRKSCLKLTVSRLNIRVFLKVEPKDFLMRRKCNENRRSYDKRCRILFS